MQNKRISHWTKLLGGFLLLGTFFFGAVRGGVAQEVVDKTVATVDDRVGTPELITYSDLLWTLAMVPDIPLDPPSSEDLNRALELVIDQRLLAIEAKRLPGLPPTDLEINHEINRILVLFPSTAEFEKRLRLVGFESVKDDNFERMMEERVKIEKYLDFRYRSFVVITAEDEATHYRDIFAPDFRRRFPGLAVPTLEEKRLEINQILTEKKVGFEIEDFLDKARLRAETVRLSNL